MVGEYPIVEITRAIDHLVAQPTALAAHIPEPVKSPDASLAEIGPGDVLTLGPSAVHAIGANASWCRAVHVYLGALSSIDRSLFDPDTFDEEPMTVERYAEFCRPEAAS